MGNFRHQAEVALAKYVERGHEALAFLERGDVDAALEVLAKRKAAFHNFRVAEALAAERENAPIQADPGILARWAEIAELNAKLEESLEERMESMRQELVTVRTKRQSISRYRSGGAEAKPLRDIV